MTPNPLPAVAATGAARQKAAQQRALLLEADLSEPADGKGHARIIWLITIAIAGLLAWSALTPVYETVTGEGRLMPLDGVRALQAEHGGRVTAVHRREGDTVRQGDPLVSFDRTHDISQLEQLEARRSALQLELERQAAILDDEDFTPAIPELGALGQSQKTAFETGAAAVQSKLNLIAADRELARAHMDEAASRLMELEKRRVILADRLTNFDSLFQRGGAISRRDRDQAELHLIEVREEIAVLKAQHRSAELRFRKAQAEGTAVLAARRHDAARAMVEIETELLELGEEISRHRLRAGSGTLTSPVSGVIQSITVDTEGQVVGAGGPVAEIVPDGAELFAEVLIPASKIGGIEPGFEGSLRLLTFDVSRFGTIDGTVVSVSPSSELVEGQEAVYLVRLQIDDEDLTPGQSNLIWRPGLSVAADIRLGSRTVLQYFLKPLQAVRDAAFSEH